MKHDHFVVQSPDTPAKQLLLLFHAWATMPSIWDRLAAGLHPFSHTR